MVPVRGLALASLLALCAPGVPGLAAQAAGLPHGVVPEVPVAAVLGRAGAGPAAPAVHDGVASAAHPLQAGPGRVAVRAVETDRSTVPGLRRPPPAVPRDQLDPAMRAAAEAPSRVSAAPEPAHWAVLAAGGMLVLRLSWRRRR